jgi:hypothetical protein
MIIQPALDIPQNILEGLLSGELVRHGGVVRNLAGQVVKHLDEVPIPVNNQESNLLRIADMLKKHKVGIIIGIGVVIVAGGVALFVADKNKKNKQNAAPEIPEYIEGYNTALCAYLDAVRNGTLDVDTINNLLVSLERVKENNDGDKIKIDFSTEQSDTLVNLVFDYTRKLAEANSIEVGELDEPVFDSAENAMQALQRYLQTQKRIFEEAA